MVEDSIIEAELALIREKQKNSSLSWYLNNFHCILPGGFHRSFFLPEMRNKKLSKLIKEEDKKNYSGLRLNQTLDEFHAVIDAVIKNLEISQQDIAEYHRRRSEDDDDSELIDRAIIPIYIELRRMGYRRYADLVV